MGLYKRNNTVQKRGTKVITIKRSRKIEVQPKSAEIIQLYPFWDETPEEAMRLSIPHSPCAVSLDSTLGTAIGEGCYIKGSHDAG